MPAFVAMVTMPYTFSIGYGIIAGLLLWSLGSCENFMKCSCAWWGNPHLRFHRFSSTLKQGGYLGNSNVFYFQPWGK